MRTARRSLAIAAAVSACFLGPAPAQSPQQPEFAVLVFSKTTAYRHESIPAAIAAVRALGAANGIAVVATEDSGAFTAGSLARYKVVMFLMTTGEVLDAGQKAAFERYIRAGGGFVGVHSAADTEYDWPFYRGLLGASFASHPAIQPAGIRIEDREHISTRALPEVWSRTDEWYNFQSNPRGSVHVLATLDESSYEGGTMGGDHPVIWCHDFEGGRSWYAQPGHTVESYSEPLFRGLLLGGIRSVAGIAPSKCPKPDARGR